MIAVYAVVLALALPIAGRVITPLGRARLAVLGLLVFGAASFGCGAVSSIAPLLVLRGAQAAGGALVLVAAFGELRGAERGARLWVYAAIIGSAAGPALGGALTELWSWRAIFYAQVPVAVIAAAVYLPAALRRPVRVPEPAPEPLRDRPAAFALALASASLAAVLFLLVLMLVAGFSHAPLAAAASVTVLPVAALLADRLAGSPRVHAATGCMLIASGVACVAFLPGPELGWVLVPAALAGAGMGLALPALAGDLLPERNEREAARLLSIRHAGIAIAILGLAPMLAHELTDQTRQVRLQGTALILDAKIDPQAKLKLAPILVNDIRSRDPRDGLTRAFVDAKPSVSGDQAVALETVGKRLDDVLVHAVVDAFRPVVLICAGLGLLGALLLLLPLAGAASIATQSAGRPRGGRGALNRGSGRLRGTAKQPRPRAGDHHEPVPGTRVTRLGRAQRPAAGRGAEGDRPRRVQLRLHPRGARARARRRRGAARLREALRQGPALDRRTARRRAARRRLAPDV